MLPAYLNGSSSLRLGDVVAVSSYVQKTVGYFQGWRKYPGLVTFPHFLCQLPILPWTV